MSLSTQYQEAKLIIKPKIIEAWMVLYDDGSWDVRDHKPKKQDPFWEKQTVVYPVRIIPLKEKKI